MKSKKPKKLSSKKTIMVNSTRGPQMKAASGTLKAG